MIYSGDAHQQLLGQHVDEHDSGCHQSSDGDGVHGSHEKEGMGIGEVNFSEAQLEMVLDDDGTAICRHQGGLDQEVDQEQ